MAEGGPLGLTTFVTANIDMRACQTRIKTRIPASPGLSTHRFKLTEHSAYFMLNPCLVYGPSFKGSAIQKEIVTLILYDNFVVRF